MASSGCSSTGRPRKRFWVGFCGTLIGGQLYPGVSEKFFGWAGERAIAYSLSTVIGTLTVLAFFCYLILMVTTRRQLRRDDAAAG